MGLFYEFNVLIYSFPLDFFSQQKLCKVTVGICEMPPDQGIPLQYAVQWIPTEGLPELKDEVYDHPGGTTVDRDHSLKSESLESANGYHRKLTYPNDLGSWSTFHPDSNNVQQCQLNVVESQFYPLLVDNRLQCAPFNFFQQSNPYEHQFQNFQYFVGYRF